MRHLAFKLKSMPFLRDFQKITLNSKLTHAFVSTKLTVQRPVSSSAKDCVFRAKNVEWNGFPQQELGLTGFIDPDTCDC